MNTHGFERINDVLAHLTAAMDANIDRAHRKRTLRLQEFGTPVIAEQMNRLSACDLTEPSHLSGLLDTINRRFETFAKRLRHSD